MIRDLINITSDEIKASAAKNVENDGTLIMHLHNYGEEACKPNSDNMDAWIYEDIDG